MHKINQKNRHAYRLKTKGWQLSFSRGSLIFLVHISTIWLFGLLSKGRDVSGKKRSVLHAQHRTVICRGFFFCPFIKWYKRIYEGIYDSVKVGTAENQAGMP